MADIKQIQVAGTTYNLKDDTARQEIIELSAYVKTPIATYTHTTNKEVVISAVDVTTNRFTSVAHGLADGNEMYPIMNYSGGAIYPIKVYPSGITYKVAPGYFAKKIDNDTFELYTDVALTTIVDITANADMDLTKWHFEKFEGSLIITGLNEPRYRVKIRCRILRNNIAGTWILPNGISESYWMRNGATTYADATLNACGDIYVGLDVLIDFTKLLTINAKGVSVKSNTAIANISTLIDKVIINPTRRDGAITSITFSGFEMANGSTVEVYKA